MPLDTFTAYGAAFQQKFVPDLEDELVVALEQAPDGFRLSLDNGETLDARHVVVAVGLSDFRQIPAELAALPASALSHSADHHDLSAFKGRDVTVIGGGSSALDIVAALRAAGAQPRLVARRGALQWNMPSKTHPWRWYPISGLGGGWRNAFFEHAPMVFRRLPQETRLQIVRRWLGPAGGWPARKYVEQSPVMLGQRLRDAAWRGGRVELNLVGGDGRESTVSTDHVIAATGYKVDLRRLKFLDEILGPRVRTIESTPVLSPNFEVFGRGSLFRGAGIREHLRPGHALPARRALHGAASEPARRGRVRSHMLDRVTSPRDDRAQLRAAAATARSGCRRGRGRQWRRARRWCAASGVATCPVIAVDRDPLAPALHSRFARKCRHAGVERAVVRRRDCCGSERRSLRGLCCTSRPTRPRSTVSEHRAELESRYRIRLPEPRAPRRADAQELVPAACRGARVRGSALRAPAHDRPMSRALARLRFPLVDQAFGQDRGLSRESSSGAATASHPWRRPKRCAATSCRCCPI